MKLNKLSSLLMAGCLMASLAVPAFAAETTDITINAPSGEVASTYQAWKILKLTTSLKSDVDHTAEGHECGDNCWNYSYTVNDKYAAALDALILGSADDTSKIEKTSAEVIEYISAMEDDGDDIRTFADALYAKVKDMAVDATSVDNVFEDADQGYYLIAEKDNAADPDSTSLVMLDTKGQSDITIESKEDIPTVVKKVKEETPNDDALTGGWQDTADYDIGDDVPFQLKATLPDNINNYQNAYKLIFHDTLSTNLSLNSDSFKVYIAGDEIDASFYTVSDVTDGSFTVTISDVLAAAKGDSETTPKLSSSSLVVVEYTAELLETADLGNPGQDNAVYLEFSSNPYVESKTSQTTEDVVTVFTYQAVISKVDPDDQPLKGANFKLMKWNGSAYEDYKTLEENADATTFTFTGLDRGQYKLVETKVPAGYNKAADVEFVIEPTMPTEAADPALSALEVKDLGGNVLSDESGEALFTATVDTGVITADVVNSTGVHLPSTGAAGTYMIYGAGALLLVGGIALVITKTRKKSEDEAVQG